MSCHPQVKRFSTIDGSDPVGMFYHCVYQKDNSMQRCRIMIHLVKGYVTAEPTWSSSWLGSRLLLCTTSDEAAGLTSKKRMSWQTTKTRCGTVGSTRKNTLSIQFFFSCKSNRLRQPWHSRTPVSCLSAPVCQSGKLPAYKTSKGNPRSNLPTRAAAGSTAASCSSAGENHRFTREMKKPTSSCHLSAANDFLNISCQLTVRLFKHFEAQHVDDFKIKSAGIGVFSLNCNDIFQFLLQPALILTS